MVKQQRKIVIEKINNKRKRMVTFSKRCQGTTLRLDLPLLYWFFLRPVVLTFLELLPSISSSISSSALLPPPIPPKTTSFLLYPTHTPSTTTENNYPEPWRSACEDDCSQASTSYANDAVCSSVTDSQSGTTTLPIQKNRDEGRWGVWLDDKFEIQCNCETVDKLMKIKNTLVQLRQSIASKILRRHGPEIFFI